MMSHLIEVYMMGVRALMSYTVDETEHTRRCRSWDERSAITDPDVLELLLSLPVGAPVPTATLTPREWGGLRVTPPWAATVSDSGSVTRWAVPPVTVDLATVEAPASWRKGLEKAGRFTPFCARRMLIKRRPRDAEEMLTQADFYGVGVTLGRGDLAEVLLPPAPWKRLRVTAAGWVFQERVYRQHCLYGEPPPRSENVKESFTS